MTFRFWRICVISVLTAAVVMPRSSLAQDRPQPSEQRRTKPIEPPHKPAQQGFRLTAAIGFSLIQNGKYSYNTTVTMPGGAALGYYGTQRSTGGAFSLGLAGSPAGRLRRFTLGFDLNFGGLEAWSHSVIAPGTITPFSQSNLNAQVTRRSLTSSPWRPFVSPYIEHELGPIMQNRVRLGYQYFRTEGSYTGSFAADQSGFVQAGYSVRFLEASHMIRLSVHNDTWFDETDQARVPPKRRFGWVQQGGLLIGTDGAVVIFVNVGPVWTF